jgi:hypothetical protein
LLCIRVHVHVREWKLMSPGQLARD